VASRVGGIPELTGEDAAVLVPAGDAGALAAAILAVITDPSAAARLRAAATERGGALLDCGDAVDSVVALYRRVLGTMTRTNGSKTPNRS
jgi:glycosyltransferase involved in cell wall biosynthesis